jgi:hypothetical protein
MVGTAARTMSKLGKVATEKVTVSMKKAGALQFECTAEFARKERPRSNLAPRQGT